MAQSGSALQWGCRGRRFKSSRPDQCLSVGRVSASRHSAPALTPAGASSSLPPVSGGSGLLGRLLAPPLLLTALAAAGCGGEKTALQAFEEGDYQTAYSLFKPRAEAGDSEAQNYLGVLYYLGLGVRRNWPQALRWYEQAAKQGDPKAQLNYGLMFHNAYGTGQDMVEAFSWYYASYRQGNPTAKRYMESLAAENKLSPNQMNFAKRNATEYILNPVVAEQASEGRLFRGQQAARN